MHQSGNEVCFWSAVAIGIGAMVGTRIFAFIQPRAHDVDLGRVDIHIIYQPSFYF